MIKKRVSYILSRTRTLYLVYYWSELIIVRNKTQKIQTGYYTGNTQQCQGQTTMRVQGQQRKVHIPVFSSKKGRQEEKREKGKVRLEKGEEIGALSAMRHGRT